MAEVLGRTACIGVFYSTIKRRLLPGILGLLSEDREKELISMSELSEVGLAVRSLRRGL